MRPAENSSEGTQKTAKPRLVYFRYHRKDLPEFIRLHAVEQAACLGHFFDVTVVDWDCDYGEICDRYQPDLSLFESGVYVGKRNITNTSACPSVPKVGFCNSDAHCPTRDVFISDMARWGVETFMTHSVSLPEYSPELADDLFVWPNFVDAETFRDYGVRKTTPVLMTGSQAVHYPWRIRMSPILSQNYPCLMSPHFGWFQDKRSSRMITGEEYALMINAAWFVPSCGTIAKDLTRKVFEIPAARACLITERTPAVEAAGFVDGVNCIFADGPEVLERIDYLFRNREELNKIIEAGHELVHSRHRSSNRDQLFQWFQLHQGLKPGQRIVQPGPFKPLVVVEENSPARMGHLIGPAPLQVLLREGDEKLQAGKYDEAEALFLQCLNYHSTMAEPKLRLALCSLQRGNAGKAMDWITQPLTHQLKWYGAVDPDPVEWSWFIAALLCQGKLDEAKRRAGQFASLRHPELDRMRHVIGALSGSQHDTQSRESVNYRRSLHHLPKLSSADWKKNLASLLRACGQETLAADVSKVEMETADIQDAKAIKSVGGSIKPGDALGDAEIFPLVTAPFLPRVRKDVEGKAKSGILGVLRSLEKKFGAFLPYRYSIRKNDPFLMTVRDCARREEIGTALVLGASAGRESTEAFLAGLRENPNKPVVYCANESPSEFAKLRRRYAGSASIHCCEASDAISKAAEKSSGTFDAVFVDVSEISTGGSAAAEQMAGARLVLLDGINSFNGHQLHRILVEDSNYSLVDFDAAQRKGYAIFKKMGTEWAVDAANMPQSCIADRP